VLKLLSRLRQRQRVTNPAELRAFLMAEAALLSQRSTFGYCQARAGSGWYKLIQEETFIAALEATRWQAFAAVLADMMLVTEGLLRPHSPAGKVALAEALAEMLSDLLAAAPAPDAVRPELKALSAAFPARIARSQLGEAHAPAEIAKTSGERLFELMPIHPSLRVHDREMIINGVRLDMVGFSEKLSRNLDRPSELAARLTGSAGFRGGQ
jgi:hypothetical protein